MGLILFVTTGSSVATSLAPGEAIDKNVGLLKIKGSRMKMIPIPLKTVRPFIYDELVLAKPDTLDFTHVEPAANAEEVLKQKIEEMIQIGNEKSAGMLECFLEQ